MLPGINLGSAKDFGFYKKYGDGRDGSKNFNGDHRIASVYRTSNVATITTQGNHGLSTNDVVLILGCTTTAYNSVLNAGSIGWKTITVTGDTTFTYANSGANQATTADTTGFVYLKVTGVKQYTDLTIDTNCAIIWDRVTTIACSTSCTINGKLVVNYLGGTPTSTGSLTAQSYLGLYGGTFGNIGSVQGLGSGTTSVYTYINPTCFANCYPNSVNPYTESFFYMYPNLAIQSWAGGGIGAQLSDISYYYGGFGAGCIYLEARTFTVGANGLLSADGGLANNGNSGTRGGYGGNIIIKTSLYSNNGIIQALGGLDGNGTTRNLSGNIIILK